MANMKVEGEAIKKLIECAKKRRRPFRLRLGAGDEDHVRIIHRIKRPEFFGHAAHREGTGNKTAFCTFDATERIITLNCKRELPAKANSLYSRRTNGTV